MKNINKIFIFKGILWLALIALIIIYFSHLFTYVNLMQIGGVIFILQGALWIFYFLSIRNTFLANKRGLLLFGLICNPGFIQIFIGIGAAVLNYSCVISLVPITGFALSFLVSLIMFFINSLKKNQD